MLSLIKSKRFLTSLLFAIFAFCASLAYNITPLFQFKTEVLEEVIGNSLGEMLPVLISGSLFVFIITLFCYYIGDFLREKIHLGTNKIDKKGIIVVVCGTVIPAILIGIIDFLTYGMYDDGFFDIFYAVVNTSSSILYSGVVEEIWFRFAFLPIMIFVMYNVFNKETKSDKIDKKYYLYGLIFSVLFLYVFQFTTIFRMEYFTLVLFLRTLLVYLVPNFLYSVLYLKYNLKVSIVAHSVFLLMYIGIVPYILSFFIL